MIESTRVSVVTPTFGRQHLLPALCRVFAAQTHMEKELVILDDSPQPWQDLASVAGPGVRYIYSQTRLTVGAKRDRLVHEASGEVIVNFDDDDYYTPTYIEEMLKHLGQNDLVKLSGWFIYSCASQQLFYWKTEELAAVHYVLGRDAGSHAMVNLAKLGEDRQNWIVTKLLGYGFSYVFRRSICSSVGFDATMNHGEDYHFVRQCIDRGFRVETVADDRGLSLNVIHTRHLSRVFPNYRLPDGIFDRLFGVEARQYLRDAHGCL